MVGAGIGMGIGEMIFFQPMTFLMRSFFFVLGLTILDGVNVLVLVIQLGRTRTATFISVGPVTTPRLRSRQKKQSYPACSL